MYPAFSFPDTLHIQIEYTMSGLPFRDWTSAKAKKILHTISQCRGNIMTMAISWYCNRTYRPSEICTYTCVLYTYTCIYIYMYMLKPSFGREGCPSSSWPGWMPQSWHKTWSEPWFFKTLERKGSGDFDVGTDGWLKDDWHYMNYICCIWRWFFLVIFVIHVTVVGLQTLKRPKNSWILPVSYLSAQETSTVHGLKTSSRSVPPIPPWSNQPISNSLVMTSRNENSLKTLWLGTLAFNSQRVDITFPTKHVTPPKLSQLAAPWKGTHFSGASC